MSTENPTNDACEGIVQHPVLGLPLPGESPENEGEGIPFPDIVVCGDGNPFRYDSFEKVPDVFDDSHVPVSNPGFNEENLYDTMIRQAMRDMKSRGWGSCPSHLQEQLLERVRVKPVNWKQKLRELSGRMERMYKNSTFRKLNRKYPNQHPGYKTSHTAKILVAVDESGSVSDDLLAKLFAAMDQLSGNISFYLCPFTSEIDPKDISRIHRHTKLPKKRDLSGGTDFQVVTDFVNKSGEFEALIIATDMECYRPGQCRVPRWWITDIDGAKQNAESRVSGSEPVIVVED